MKKEDEFANILLCAVMGNQDSLEEIFNIYNPLICKYCYINGKFDEDLKQQIHINIALNISKFHI